MNISHNRSLSILRDIERNHPVDGDAYDDILCPGIYDCVNDVGYPKNEILTSYFHRLALYSNYFLDEKYENKLSKVSSSKSKRRKLIAKYTKEGKIRDSILIIYTVDVYSPTRVGIYGWFNNTRYEDHQAAIDFRYSKTANLWMTEEVVDDYYDSMIALSFEDYNEEELAVYIAKNWTTGKKETALDRFISSEIMDRNVVSIIYHYTRPYINHVVAPEEMEKWEASLRNSKKLQRWKATGKFHPDETFTDHDSNSMDDGDTEDGVDDKDVDDDGDTEDDVDDKDVDDKDVDDKDVDDDGDTEDDVDDKDVDDKDVDDESEQEDDVDDKDVDDESEQEDDVDDKDVDDESEQEDDGEK